MSSFNIWPINPKCLGLDIIFNLQPFQCFRSVPCFLKCPLTAVETIIVVFFATMKQALIRGNSDSAVIIYDTLALAKYN